MYKDKSILAVVTARGGSKRIPKKNLSTLGGMSLLERTLIAAAHSALLDRTILSSEDDEIIAHAVECACEVPFIRPAELASDEATSYDVLEHAIHTLEDKYDYIVLLQPTSPFRLCTDIDMSIRECIDKQAPACVSVSIPRQSPYLSCTISANRKIEPLLDIGLMQGKRSQDLPEAYCINGAVYVARTAWLLKNKTFVTEDTVAYIMPASRSIDIDESIDLRIAGGLI